MQIWTTSIWCVSLTTEPLMDKLIWAFKYIYLLDILKAAVAEVLYNLLNKLKNIYQGSKKILGVYN